MQYYLSRVSFNPLSAAAMRQLGSPDQLHALICKLFDESRDGARFLFRVDTIDDAPCLLVQSAAAPDWSRVQFADRALRAEPETKAVSVSPQVGERLLFRLLTRPVKRESSGKGNKPGPRRDLRTDEERLEWLRRKSRESGFRIVTCGLTILSLPAIHSDRTYPDRGGVLTAVRYDGELEVEDPAALEDALAGGIGTQKAFGFGLLSVGKVR